MNLEKISNEFELKKRLVCKKTSLQEIETRTKEINYLLALATLSFF
jgi:hypothetical protein